MDAIPIMDTISKQYQSSPATFYVAAGALLVTLIYYVLKSKNLPPGPRGVPILGYLPFLNDKTCHQELSKVHEKYGDMFSINVTGKLYLSLGSHKILREVFISKSEYFASRPSDFNPLFHLFEGGVSFLNGEPWKVLRKFFLQEFRERGVSSAKNNFSEPLFDCIASTVDEIHAVNGKPINLIELMTRRCNLVLKSVLFGGGGISEEEIKNINEAYGNTFVIMTPTNFLLGGSVAKCILSFSSAYKNALKEHGRVKDMINKVMENHKRTYSEDNVRSVVDSYLKERNDRKKKGDPTYQYFTDKALTASLLQFIGDGVVGVSTFIASFFKYVMQYPEEQEKIYQELMEVVGHSRNPTLDDKAKLPYTNAFINEILRLSDFFPFFPSVECTKEFTFKNYTIPKGSIALVNMWNCHHDPKTYDDPWVFNPSRFIAKEGKPREELPLAFGIGKRSCLGEAYVMGQVFLFLTTIIKHFKLIIPEGITEEEMRDLFMSLKLEVIAQPRSQKK